jgi:hypothetical protein
MKKEEIENLKDECLKSPPFKKAHFLKLLWENNVKDEEFYKLIKKTSNNNSAVEAILNKIFSELKIMKKEEELVNNYKKELSKKNLKKEDRFDIYKEISNLKSDKRKELLLMGLSESSWEIRDFISNIIFNDNAFSIEDIMNIAENPLWLVRREGLKILGKRGEEILFNYTDKILEETNADIKITFIEAAENIGGKKAYTTIYRFKKDSNQWVKKRAEKALKTLSKSLEHEMLLK